MFDDFISSNNVIPTKNQEYVAYHVPNEFKSCRLDQNYFGKGNQIIDEYNQKKAEVEYQDKFDKTKNKIKVVVYKNGFILNDGPFREKSIQENFEFLESVEKGIIPQEFIRKGIKDLGILVINRKEELYGARIRHSLPTSLNYLGNLNNKPHSGNHILDEFFRNNAQTRNQRNSAIYNSSRTITRISPKLEDFKTDKKARKEKRPSLFVPFAGKGQLLGDAKIEGFSIDKSIKNKIDKSSQICTISIKLYNGEMIDESFNCNQKLKDIYQYVSKITGLDDFCLIKECSSSNLTDMEKTILELRIEGTVLAQKLK